MSVQQIEPKILVYIAKGLYKIAFNTTVNEWYSTTAREQFKDPETVWPFMQTVADANAFNYTKKYPADASPHIK